MNEPTIYDWPDHYEGNGLSSFNMTLSYPSGAQIDFSNCHVHMQFKNSIGKIGWEFSDMMAGDNALVLLPGGVIKFPQIKSWEITPSKYRYDIKVTDNVGFVKYYVQGSLTVFTSITK
jgi:hypothetical protein